MNVAQTAQIAQEWANATGGRGALLSAYFLDLLDDADAPYQPINLRTSRRAPAEVMEELAAEVMPKLKR